MKYSACPERYDGAVDFPMYPCDGIAADDTVLPGCIYIDTETGVTIRHKKKDDGDYFFWGRGTAGGVVEILEIFPAPIQIVPYDEKRHITPTVVIG